MVEQYLWQSPLAPLKLEARAVARSGDAGVVLAERAGLGMIELRGDAGDAAFRAETERALGFALPVEPNTVAEGRRRRSLWLGPEQWLVVTAPGEAGALARDLDRALHDLPASAVDVSEARAVVELSGPRAREVLMKGTSLDVHPRAFAVGRCASTRLAKATVALHLRDAAPAFDLYVARSFARYLWAWLEDAATGYGVAVVRGEPGI